MNLNKPNDPICAQMCLNKLKRAWVCLSEPKSTLMVLNELI